MCAGVEGESWCFFSLPLFVCSAFFNLKYATRRFKWWKIPNDGSIDTDRWCFIGHWICSKVVRNCPSIFKYQTFSFSIISVNEEVHDKLALLEEHERLNASLAALTRHFAHVQLRLQQVVCAPTTEDREVWTTIFSSTRHFLVFLSRRISSLNYMNLLPVEYLMSCVNHLCTQPIELMKN